MKRLAALVGLALGCLLAFAACGGFALVGQVFAALA